VPQTPRTPTFPERSDITTDYVIRPGLLSLLIVAVGLSTAVSAGTGYTLLRKDVSIVHQDVLLRQSTFKRTVQDALDEAGVRLGPDHDVSPASDAPLREGLRIVVRRPVPVTIIADGKVRTVQSAAPTVATLLVRHGITLSASDKVFPSPQTPLQRGLRVRVVRVHHEIENEQTVIPFQVRRTPDPTVSRGVVGVVSSGRPGLRERVWRVTRADGQVTGRSLLGWRIVRDPLDRMLSVGAQPRGASDGPFAGRAYLDLIATAYAPFCCKGVDDITALGIRAGYGVVAVDPRVIPLGSRLYIEGYGYAIAADTGSAIKGLRIDLGYDTMPEAIRFGRRPVRVYIIQ